MKGGKSYWQVVSARQFKTPIGVADKGPRLKSQKISAQQIQNLCQKGWNAQKIKAPKKNKNRHQ